MTRPSHLPDYGAPPLNEVVVGIQFRPAEGYQQIRAGEVWALYKDHFPKVEEHQRLPPQFETFGPLMPERAQFQFVEGAEHDRFWFLNDDGEELIQFQSDRLLHNWRHQSAKPYPRFETMVSEFESQAVRLERYFSSLKPQKIDITQCEVSYINHFDVTNDSGFNGISDYVRLISFPSTPEDMAFRYRRPIFDKDGNKSGRFYCECTSALTRQGKPIFSMTLTVRGSPNGSGINDAIAFLRLGRDMIVEEFTTITTDKAHRLWERIQ